MKKNDVILALSALVFSGLFYEQEPGINFPLFSFLLSVLLLVFNPENAGNKRWWLYALCLNVAGLSVFFVNSVLSVLAFMAAVLVLAGKSTSEKNSMFVSGLFSVYSVFRSPFDLAKRAWNTYSNRGDVTKGKNWRPLIAGALALVFGFIFLLLYRSANPLFRDLTGKMDFEMPDLSWFVFTVFSFILLTGLSKTKKIALVSETDLLWRQDVKQNQMPDDRKTETTTLIATGLFLVLNLMLLAINVLDLVNIHITKTLPAGITLSDFVHQAVESLIVSLILGATLIAWLFYGDLNFNRSAKWLRIFVYAWIVQSVLVVINTLVRNFWYTNAYQLSHLRIGVYVFLILSLFGLLYTFLKVKKHKSTWWLASTNLSTWFFVLLFFSLFNWDGIITNFNVRNASNSKPLDKLYLLNLGDGNLPQLTALHNQGAFNSEERKILYRKMYRAYKYNRFQQWPSFNMRMAESNKALAELAL